MPKKEIDITDLYALKPGKLWAAFKNEHISFWMLIIYFSFEYVRPQSLYPVLDVFPWGQFFLLMALLTAIVDPSARTISNVENKLFILFSFVVVLSSVFAFMPSRSLANWDIFTGWVLIYFLVVNVVNTEKRLILFVLAYCLFNLKMGQHGTVVFLQRSLAFANYGIKGAPGWFSNSGEYAIQMLIFSSLAFSIVIGLKDYWGRYKKWLMFAAAGTGYFAVIGASSRGSQVALAIIAIWILLKQQNGFKGLLLITVLAILLFNVLPEQQLQRFQEIGQDKGSLQRLAYWEFGLQEIVPKYPVLGVGYGNWGAYVNFAAPEGLGPERIFGEASHNIFIQAVTDLGIVGLISFLLLVIYGFINNARTRKMASAVNNKFLFYLSYGLDAGLIGYLVAGCFVTVLFYPFFWVQIAMIVAVNNVSKLEMRKREV